MVREDHWSFDQNLEGARSLGAPRILLLVIVIPFNSSGADDFALPVYQIELAVLLFGIFEIDSPIPMLRTPGSPSYLRQRIGILFVCTAGNSNSRLLGDPAGDIAVVR